MDLDAPLTDVPKDVDAADTSTKEVGTVNVVAEIQAEEVGMDTVGTVTVGAPAPSKTDPDTPSVDESGVSVGDLDAGPRSTRGGVGDLDPSSADREDLSVVAVGDLGAGGTCGKTRGPVDSTRRGLDPRSIRKLTLATLANYLSKRSFVYKRLSNPNPV